MKNIKFSALLAFLLTFSCSQKDTSTPQEDAHHLKHLKNHSGFVESSHAAAVVLGGHPNSSFGSYTAFFATFPDGSPLLVSTADNPSTCAREGCVRHFAFHFEKGPLSPEYTTLVIKPLIHHPSLGVGLFRAYHAPSETAPLEERILSAHTPFTPPHSFPIAPTYPGEQEEVWALGHPFGTLKKAFWGKVLTVTPHSFSLDAGLPVDEGEGWPVVDAQGRIAGVATTNGPNALFGEEGLATELHVVPSPLLWALYQEAKRPMAQNAFVSVNTTFTTFSSGAMAQKKTLGYARLEGLDPHSLSQDAFRDSYQARLFTYLIEDRAHVPEDFLTELENLGPCPGALPLLNKPSPTTAHAPHVQCLGADFAQRWLPTLLTKLEEAINENGLLPGLWTGALIAPFHILPNKELLDAYGAFVIKQWPILARHHKAFLAPRLAQLTGSSQVEGRSVVDYALDYSGLKLKMPGYFKSLIFLESYLIGIYSHSLISQEDLSIYQTSLGEKVPIMDKVLGQYLKFTKEKNDFLHLHPIPWN